MTKNNNYKFWQDFKAIVEQNSISPKAAEWYLKWAKAFENALSHISLHERTKNDVKAYLDTLIRRGNLEDWQINQANHSLCLLFEHFLDLKWANPWPDFLPNNDDTQSDHGQIRKNEIRFKDIPKKPLGDIGPYQHAQKKRRVPVVLTVEEKDRVLTEMKGMYALMAGIIYGSGLRLMECVRLRVKDVDFAQRQIVVRNGKGGKDRVTVLPDKYADTLQQHLAEVKKIHESDLSKGYGEVYLWPSPERKYKNFAKEWGWQYVFPATKLSVDPMGGKVRRHHISESSLILMISSVSKSDWGCPQMNF